MGLTDLAGISEPAYHEANTIQHVHIVSNHMARMIQIRRDVKTDS